MGKPELEGQGLRVAGVKVDPHARHLLVLADATDRSQSEGRVAHPRVGRPDATPISEALVRDSEPPGRVEAAGARVAGLLAAVPPTHSLRLRPLRTAACADSIPLAATTLYAAVMGVLFDYFAAPTPEAAAAAIDWVGGPSQPPAASKERRRLFGKRANAPGPTEASPYRTVQDAGVDPVVQMGTLEEILTGRSFDEILDSHAPTPVAERDGGQRLVSKVSDGLVDALATATPESLTEAARPWSQTEEFWGAGDAEVLAELLAELSDLALHARANGESVYCWSCI